MSINRGYNIKAFEKNKTYVLSRCTCFLFPLRNTYEQFSVSTVSVFKRPLNTSSSPLRKRTRRVVYAISIHYRIRCVPTYMFKTCTQCLNGIARPSLICIKTAYNNNNNNNNRIYQRFRLIEYRDGFSVCF